VWLRMGEHLLGGQLVELDVADCVLFDEQLLAWAPGSAPLTDRCLSELDFPPVRVAVHVNVGDTHGGRLNVYIYIALLLCSGDRVPKDVRSCVLSAMCSKVRKSAVYCGGYRDLFIQISQWVLVSLRSQG
jgi:hypothetical protein